MRKAIKKKDTLALRGFIEIEKINIKNHTREVYRNTITNAGKQFLLDKSASLMLGMAADVFGMTACSNTLTKLSVGNSATAVAGRNARSDRDITNVLLNLDENVLTGLGASTTFINVFDDELESASHLIGYANNNVVPTGDTKEGNIDFSKGEYLVDPYTICKRWKYAEGIATGTINCVAMMPASCIKQNNGDGIKFSKCIDQINTQYTNYLNMSTGFLIPGIPGYTANNEILLNFNKDSNARWKYNIGTGEITSVPITDNFFIPTAGIDYDIVDMQYIDNYLYVLSLGVGSSNPTIHVDVYDPANAMNKVANFNCNTDSRSEYEIKASIFKVGSTLYVSAISDRQTTRETVSKLWSLNKSGGARYASSASAAQTDFSSIGLTIPSGLDIRFTGLGRYNGNYILYNLVQMYDNVSASRSNESSSSFGYKMTGIVFTDLSDPIGSAVDMIDGITPNEIMFSAGSTAGTLRVGFDKFNSAGTEFGRCYDLVDDKHIIMNNTSTTNRETVTVDTTKTGVYLSLDKWWTNVISFVKLSTPIVKAANDIIYVSYGYKIVV